MDTKLSRRDFSKAAALVALTGAMPNAATAAQAPELEVTDTHVHFYDPSRPQGVPWPDKDDKVLYRTVLPKEYLAIPVRYPASGMIVVEASPWVEDNQWVLDLAEKNGRIVGSVGNLPAGTEKFQSHLKRLAKNPRFRGVRPNGLEVREHLDQKAFLADLHALRDLDLELDLNGGPEMLPDVVKVAAAVKELRIVIDHVANVKIDGKAPPESWVKGMEDAAKSKNVYCKVSGLVEGTGRSDGSAPAETEFYRPVLDAVWKAFGEDRLIYGSNWPVSAPFASLATVQSIVISYFGGRGKAAMQKVMAVNAAAAYKHVKLEW